MTTSDGWPTEARDLIAVAEPCTHHLWDDPDSYCCTRTDTHDTHAYASRDVEDAHDDSERKATA